MSTNSNRTKPRFNANFQFLYWNAIAKTVRWCSSRGRYKSFILVTHHPVGCHLTFSVWTTLRPVWVWRFTSTWRTAASNLGFAVNLFHIYFHIETWRTAWSWSLLMLHFWIRALTAVYDMKRLQIPCFWRAFGKGWNITNEIVQRGTNCTIQVFSCVYAFWAGWCRRRREPDTNKTYSAQWILQQPAERPRTQRSQRSGTEWMKWILWNTSCPTGRCCITCITLHWAVSRITHEHVPNVFVLLYVPNWRRRSRLVLS